MGETGGPAMAPLTVDRGEERWRHFDNSVNAVSFGFVATAILIFMFLVMAVFERFLRPRSSLATQLAAAGGGGLRRRRGGFDVEARGVAGKLDYPSPKMSIYAKGVSVLMPGYDIPTFIAHPAPAPCLIAHPAPAPCLIADPAPAPCLPERISWPTHEQSLTGASAPNPS